MAENSRKMAKNGPKTAQNGKNGAETANFKNFANGDKNPCPSVRIRGWGSILGSKRPREAANALKMVKNGSKTEVLAGKQENFRKSGGVEEFFVFSCPFPVFLLKFPVPGRFER